MLFFISLPPCFDNIARWKVLFFKCQPPFLDSAWSWKVLFFTQSATFKWLRLNLKSSEKCCSSLVCHIVLTALQCEKYSSSRVSHLIQTASEVEKCSCSPVLKSRWQTDEEEHFSLLFKFWRYDWKVVYWWKRALFTFRRCLNKVADTRRRALFTLWGCQKKVAHWWRRAPFTFRRHHIKVRRWQHQNDTLS